MASMTSRASRSFGQCQDWPISVRPASSVEIELIARMDRALRVRHGDGCESSKATNDPRFHVGWRHFDAERERLKSEAQELAEPARTVVENHLRSIKRLRNKAGIHPKVEVVAEAVKTTVELREKVVLFCDHHATAQELTAHLASVILGPPMPPWSKRVWKEAWDHVLESADHGYHSEGRLGTFIEWLCSDLIRAQTWNWLSPPTSEARLADAPRKSKARHSRNPETIAQAARRLYHALLDSRSSRAVLMQAADHPEHLPGANGNSRVVGVCEPSGKAREEALFLRNRQPDTAISIFNSPFGPDVLVVTDKLSEGIDLHRYCRHLIHYELDPSPIRTVQRNGRLRRVNSWSAVTGQPILYAYPAFGGTRDHRLVQIMKKRIDSFSLLLGGVHEFDVGEVVDSDEQSRNKVIETAKRQLVEAGGQLRAREPGRT